MLSKTDNRHLFLYNSNPNIQTKYDSFEPQNQSTMRISFLLSLVIFVAFKTKADTIAPPAQFVYVIQNPALFGEDSARAYFEIDGILPNETKAHINAQLKTYYFEHTGLKRSEGNTSFKKPLKKNEQLFAYTAADGSTGYLICGIKDSFIRLASVSAEYGAGKDLISFTTVNLGACAAQLKIKSKSKVVPDLLFSLNSGNLINMSNFSLLIDPKKMDSLNTELMKRAQIMMDNQFPQLKGYAIEPKPARSNYSVSLLELLKWRYSAHPEEVFGISQRYTLKTTSDKVMPIYQVTANFTVDESLSFLIPANRKKVQEICNVANTSAGRK